MKKLGLFLVGMFVVGFVMAQKTIWLTQSGIGNSANLSQTDLLLGGYQANSIFAIQSGDNNLLKTYQNGKINNLELTQGLGSGNSAVMTQETFDATSIPGGTNTATIKQSGNGNYAKLDQFEDQLYNGSNFSFEKNIANATQSGNNNVYVINQGKHAWQPMNEQTLDQSGYNNLATIVQNGYNDLSNINQIADNNDAYLTQNGPGSAGEVKSYSKQLGSFNYLNVNQPGGNPLLQYVKSDQSGNSNQTDVNQLGQFVQQVDAQETGNNNILNVTQAN